MMTPREAITRSTSHDAVVIIDYTIDAELALLRACDDAVRNGEVLEFWGHNEIGEQWRVHVRLPKMPYSRQEIGP